MSKELAVLITVAAGGLVAAQAPANNVDLAARSATSAP